MTDNDGDVVTSTQQTDTATLGPNESLNFNIQPVGGGASDWLLEVDANPQLAPPNNDFLLSHPGGPNPVDFNINVFLHEARLTVTGNCNPPPQQGGGQPAPVPTDRVFLTHQHYASTTPFFNGIPGLNPEALPETRLPFEPEIPGAEGRRDQETLLDLQTCEIDLRGLQMRRDEARSRLTIATLRDDERTVLIGQIDGLGRSIEEKRGICAGLRRLLVRTVERTGGLLRYAGEDPVQPRPWTVMPAGASASGSPNFSAEHHATLGGLPVNIWGRLQGTILEGRFGRSGAVGAGQFGVTVAVTPSLDVGVVGHLAVGEVKTGAWNGEVDSVAGGLGAYAMARMANGIRLGASTSHSWGSHDIALNGATGSFRSSYWTVDGSAAIPFHVGGLVVTPMALATWKQLSLGGYVDSNGLAMPGIADSTLALSGAVDFSYPIALDGPVVTSVTPRLSVRTNVYVKDAQTLIVGPGFTLESRSLTVDVAGGLGATLSNGGSIDLTLGVSGLAGDIQAYVGRLGLSMPLN